MNGPDEKVLNPAAPLGHWPLLGRTRRIHLVGIGGTGMSGIAEVLLNLGYVVSGSDLAETEVTRRLSSLGGILTFGHRAQNVEQADVVVYSSAVSAENVELAAARAGGIPIIPRAEMLAQLMRAKHGVAVGGAHGKTTTTWLTALVLDHGGFDPTIVVGGRLHALHSGARLGRGDFLVAEADESDGSFLGLSPTIAVVTTVAPEHLDFYPDFEAIQDAFVTFLNHVPFYGATVICLDDPGVRALVGRVERKTVTYGFQPEAMVRGLRLRTEGLSTSFSVSFQGKEMGEARVRLAGDHNALNALAAVAVGVELGIPFSRIREGLASFTGIARRMEVRAEDPEVIWVDDYAHHPDEVAATLRAARRVWPGRLVVVFQPHRYTRVKALAGSFADSFDEADVLIVSDVYAAGEKPIPGVTGEWVVKAVADAGKVRVSYVPEREEMITHLQSVLRAGDVLMTLGAGDVWRVGEEIMRERSGGRGTGEER